MIGASARYSGPHVPVETSTPPARRKVRFTQNPLTGIPRSVSLLLAFPANPLTLGFAGRGEAAEHIRVK